MKALGCLRDLEQPLKEARSKVGSVLIKSASAGLAHVFCTWSDDAGQRGCKPPTMQVSVAANRQLGAVDPAALSWPRECCICLPQSGS